MTAQPETQPDQLNIRETIGIAFGQASMCWSETPKGSYDSARAAKILADLMEKLNEMGGEG